MKYVTFDPDTGRILSSGDIPESMIQLQGEHVLLGEGSSRTHYVENGQLCLKPECPGDFYDYDYSKHCWVANQILLASSVRTQRDRLIQSTDWTQLPDVPVESKTIWAEYRQALRDITKQPGFPEQVIFPTAPQ